MSFPAAALNARPDTDVSRSTRTRRGVEGHGDTPAQPGLVPEYGRSFLDEAGISTPDSPRGAEPAVTLRLLGALDLGGPARPEAGAVLKRSKQTALLAYLVLEDPGAFHRRDALLGLLWPELDTPNARAALRQALHYLRRALGDDVVRGRGDEEIGVDPDRLRCDAVEFLEAVEGGRPAEALEAYGGELLSGFFVSGAAEFDDWMARWRNALRARAAQAGLDAAEERLGARDDAGAARFARRAVDLAAHDERVLRRAMEILDASGDRAAAVHEFERFAARLEEDLDLDPSPETRATLAAIRAREVARPAASPVAPVAPTAPVAERRLHRQRPPRIGLRSRTRLAAAAVAACAILALAASGSRMTEVVAEAPAEALTLAVPPFENLSPDPDDGFFAAGIHQEILARLGRIEGVRVIAGREGLPVAPVAGESGHVLAGSVRREGARVRITIRLVRAATGHQLWARTYDERLEDVFAVQSSVAENVARALQVRVASAPGGSGTAPRPRPEAYDHYLKGRLHADRELELESAREAVREYERAVALDPDFVEARAELARARALLYWMRPWRADLAERARADLAEARKRAPGSLETRMAEGYVRYYVDGEYADALETFRAVEAMAPGNVGAIKAIAYIHRRQGAWRSALAGFERALELDPRSFEVALEVGRTLRLVRRLDEAEPRVALATAIAPETPRAHQERALLALARGDTAAVRRLDEDPASAPHVNPGLAPYLRRDWEAARRLWRSSELEDWIRLGVALRRSGRSEELRDVAGRLRAIVDREAAFRSDAVPDRRRVRESLGRGLAAALEGRHEDAVAHGRWAVEVLSVEDDAFGGATNVWALGILHLLAGEEDEAVERLEEALSVPSLLTVGVLRVDPLYDPLRDHPGFQRLLRSG